MKSIGIGAREYSEMLKKCYLFDFMVREWGDRPSAVFEMLDKLSGVRPLQMEPEERRVLTITIDGVFND